MNDIATDGRLQVIAGTSLLDCSRLVQWDEDDKKFTPACRKAFESSWRTDIDPVFGRLICWINFSAGAEFLGKGVCLLHGVEIRKPKQVPVYPTRLSTDLSKWVTRFRKDWKSPGTVETTYFGTLGSLVNENKKTKSDPPLQKPSSIVKATHNEQELLLATYEFLAKAIRNRDAHSYVPNVRDSHHFLVADLFTPCFNLLVSWLPGGPDTLNKWRNAAE